jgi:hypothetical protein
MKRPFYTQSAQDLMLGLRDAAYPGDPEVYVDVDGARRPIDSIAEGTDGDGEKIIVLKLRQEGGISLGDNALLNALNQGICPDCKAQRSMLKGPRGGCSRNIKCAECGSDSTSRCRSLRRGTERKRREAVGCSKIKVLLMRRNFPADR